MSDRYNAAFINAAYVGPRSPNPPTIGTATKQPSSASVAFTAPSPQGGTGNITGYRAVSTPGNFTATGSSSPLLVTGLTNGQSYTFQVTSINLYGESLPSAASNAVIPEQTGQTLYTEGYFTFIVPPGITSVSVVCVGGGGAGGYYSSGAGSGGGLRYKNNITVTPGQSIAIAAPNYAQFSSAGGNASFGTNGVDAFYFFAGGGGSGSGAAVGTGTTIGAGADGGGNGGATGSYAGGGGAGGYSGNGGAAGNSPGASGSAGSGGGGGGGYGVTITAGNYSGAGGGVGVLGQGSNGAGGTGSSQTAGTGYVSESSKNGGGGSGGTTTSGSIFSVGGSYGGGGSGVYGPPSGTENMTAGGPAAVRIVYPATGGPISPRSFPSTNVGDL
jgi:hypothetical protein